MSRRPALVGPAPPERLGRAVQAWFRRAHRPLPWRGSRDPYRVWVAEVLLQQTRVEQAVPYFDRFVARFPDVVALARARASEVLKLWQGAGYYARARHLHAAARRIVAVHGGTLPRTVTELERLPGIGPYTARAIAAIAFGAPVVPVDANALRVAARWTREERDPRSAGARSSLVAYLERALPPADPAGFAEGLMELGETVCRPRAPRCGRCPAAFGCRAVREMRDPATLPRPRERPSRPHIRAAVVVLERGGRWLVQRRPEPGLLGGLWEFPGGKIRRGEAVEGAARRELREETGASAGPLRFVGVVRHGYSHFTVELHVFRGRARRPPVLGPQRRWARPSEVLRLPLPRATELVIQALRSPPGRRTRRRGRAPSPTNGGTRASR